VRREPEAVDALVAALAQARGANAAFDRHCVTLEDALRRADDDPAGGRRIAQAVALAAASAALIRHAPAFVADAYCASRLTPDACTGAAFGVLPAGVPAQRIVERVSA